MMTEDDAKRAAMGGDWEAVARWLVRRGMVVMVPEFFDGMVEKIRSVHPLPPPMPRKCQECHDQIRVQLDHQAEAIKELVTPHVMLMRGAPIVRLERPDDE
jgi:dienelactone hydrolase